MSVISNFIFQDKATTIGNGNTYINSYDAETLQLEIMGTATSFTVVFEEQTVSGNFYSTLVVNRQDYSMVSQTSLKDSTWEIGIKGLVGFRVKISTISGGNLTVSGRVVN
jgi:hypothetical protein